MTAPIEALDGRVAIHVGDCREVLRAMPDESVHCVVTSPPYFNLRDYDADGQIGLEQTPDDYVAALVDVFREVRRVLRKDGNVWLNLGDSYCTRSVRRHDGKRTVAKSLSGEASMPKWSEYADAGRATYSSSFAHLGFKDKDLFGIPWRVALALHADGWWLRSDVIWNKLNVMPESASDRPTSAHEHIFLLAKSKRYFYDADAVKESVSDASMARISQPNFEHQTGGTKDYANGVNPSRSMRKTLENFAKDPRRSLRNVWTLASHPFAGAHFATFPPSLPEACIKAGTSERGCCPTCGASWARIVEAESRPNAPACAGKYDGNGKHRTFSGGVTNDRRARIERGWEPTCKCGAADLVPAVVLDPFGGAGTTGVVAARLGRRAILIELNSGYAEMARRRIEMDWMGETGRRAALAEVRGIPPLEDSPLFGALGDEPEGKKQ